MGVARACRITYVYDLDGDKIRTVQFRAAGLDRADQLRTSLELPYAPVLGQIARPA